MFTFLLDYFAIALTYVNQYIHVSFRVSDMTCYRSVPSPIPRITCVYPTSDFDSGNITMPYHVIPPTYTICVWWEIMIPNVRLSNLMLSLLSSGDPCKGHQQSNQKKPRPIIYDFWKPLSIDASRTRSHHRNQFSPQLVCLRHSFVPFIAGLWLADQ